MCVCDSAPSYSQSVNNTVFLIAVYFDNEDTDNSSLMVRRGDIVGIVESDERPPDGYLKVRLIIAISYGYS